MCFLLGSHGTVGPLLGLMVLELSFREENLGQHPLHSVYWPHWIILIGPFCISLSCQVLQYLSLTIKLGIKLPLRTKTSTLATIPCRMDAELSETYNVTKYLLIPDSLEKISFERCYSCASSLAIGANMKYWSGHIIGQLKERKIEKNQCHCGTCNKDMCMYSVDCCVF